MPSKICRRRHSDFFFFFFTLQISLDISCELSAKHNSHEKSRLIFFEKYKKYLKMLSAAVVIGILRVNKKPERMQVRKNAPEQKITSSDNQDHWGYSVI